MGKKKKSKGGGVNKAIRDAGPVLSNKEAKQIAKSTGKSVAKVVAKATSQGASLGSNLVNKVSKAIAAPYGSLAQSFGVTGANSRTLEALQPLQNLQLNKGTVYSGYSTSFNPASNTRTPTQRGGSTYSPGGTTYYPIVMPRGTVAGGGFGGGGGSGGGGGGGGKVKNDGTIDNIKSLYQQQMAEARAAQEAFANQMADTINTMQLDFADQLAASQTAADQEIAYLNDLMMMQQLDSQNTQAMLAQQAQAAEAAYAEQVRAAAALGKAFVPALEPTAASVQLGDQRNTRRDEANNNLSSLAITSNIGGNTNSLAGLQLA